MKKSIRDFVRIGGSPCKKSLTYMSELSTKAAQEDVCACIDEAATIILLATGHWIFGICYGIWALAQRHEATRWSLLLRAERGKMKFETGEDGNKEESK